MACQHDLARLVTKLLECGANPNLQTLPPESFGLDTDDSRVYRDTPLHLAIRANNINTVKAFLEHKGMYLFKHLMCLKSGMTKICYVPYVSSL